MDYFDFSAKDDKVVVPHVKPQGSSLKRKSCFVDRNMISSIKPEHSLLNQQKKNSCPDNTSNVDSKDNSDQD